MCYGLCVNNMQCEYDMLCMLYDVLTWVVHGGELYVSIIIIHGMLNHCMCTQVGSNSCRIIPLLGIAHPVEGSLFQVQGVFGKTTLTRVCF